MARQLLWLVMSMCTRMRWLCALPLLFAVVVQNDRLCQEVRAKARVLQHSAAMVERTEGPIVYRDCALGIVLPLRTTELVRQHCFGRRMLS